MKLIQNVINNKLNSITGDELLKYASQYDVSLTKKEADQIANHLKGKKINVFDDAERSRLIKELAQIAGNQTAKQVNQLILQFLK